jgi:hypothetical protein
MRSGLYVALIAAIAVTAVAADANAWPKWGVRKKLNNVGPRLKKLGTRTLDRFNALSPRKQATIVTGGFVLFSAALAGTAYSQIDPSSVQWLTPAEALRFVQEKGIKVALSQWDWRTQINAYFAVTGLASLLVAPFVYEKNRRAAKSLQQTTEQSLPQLAE